MRHTSKAQSLVEMALILPFLLFLCFAIIDMGWYIYGFATVYNSARRGAEEASQLPPWPNRIVDKDASDGCLAAVYKAVHDQAVLFPDILSPESGSFDIQYVDANGQAVDNTDPAARSTRQLGAAVQVSITYKLHPLTPLLTLGKTFGFGGVDGDGNAVMTVSSISRRTIDSLGSNPNYKNGMACQEFGT